MNPEWFLVLRLATADVFHEIALSLCLLLALAAVIAPLLLVFGLKHGTIATLRSRLNDDPSKREIVVRSAFTRPVGWIESLGKRPDVSFVVPKTRPLSNEVLLRAKGSVRAAIEPTAKGDPVLTFEGLSAPSENEIVLSALAADELGVTVGNPVALVAESYRDGKRVEAETSLRVSGILPSRGRRVLYAPLELLEAVEAFKDGKAVSRLGWQGGSERAEPFYQGIIILSSEALPEELLTRLLVNTGLVQFRELSPENLKEINGMVLARAARVYLLKNDKGRVGAESLEAVGEKLRGIKCAILPWTSLIEAVVDGKKTTLAGLSVSPQLAADWGIATLPSWGEKPADIYQLAGGSGIAGKQVTVFPPKGGNFPAFRVTAVVATGKPAGVSFVPNELAGILRRAEFDNLTFDEQNGELFLSRKGYSWMRLYAKSIDDVAGLARYLEREENLSISTQAERIEEVGQLNRQLSRIFYFLAGVGILGGIAALAASLYAAVERKKRELGVLRLLGLPVRMVLRFPVYQGLLLVTGGYVVAVAVSLIAAGAINGLFGQQLRTGESFCNLPLPALLAGYAIAVFFAVAAGATAALRLNRLQPSVAIREE
jgi:putative ABC transport system permease protein